MTALSGAQAQRDWFRPNPPQPRVKWSLRNNINMQRVGDPAGDELCFEQQGSLPQEFLFEEQAFSCQGRRTKVRQPGLFLRIKRRVVEAADMMNLLRLMGVEVHTADKEIYD